MTLKQRNQEKLSRIPIKIAPSEQKLAKPSWLKRRINTDDLQKVANLRKQFKDNKLHTVCEEASCPNILECFSHKTASFMILGDICTRRCSFCDVAHGKPRPIDLDEPKNLAETVKNMGLEYVVITSVDRDDLRDGGAQHFVDCIQAIKTLSPRTKVEILVPDFRGRMDKALDILAQCPPDVFNHNVETHPRLYQQARPGSDFQWSLDLLKNFKNAHPHIPTKSGIMVGLGETDDEIIEVLAHLREHAVTMCTIGQYLQPSNYHMPVTRYVSPEQFQIYKTKGESMGFDNVASGPMVRSSYHADMQAKGEAVS